MKYQKINSWADKKEFRIKFKMSSSIKLTGRRSDTDVVLTEEIANAVSEGIP